MSILLSIAATISPAHANINIKNRPTPDGEVKTPAGGVGSLIEELNLSTDQIQRLQKLRANSKGKNKERRQALRAAKQELQRLLQGNASSDQIRQQRQQVQALQREVSDTNFENTLAIREILTAEQRVKLQQLMKERRHNRGKLN